MKRIILGLGLVLCSGSVVAQFLNQGGEAQRQCECNCASSGGGEGHARKGQNQMFSQFKKIRQQCMSLMRGSKGGKKGGKAASGGVDLETCQDLRKAAQKKDRQGILRILRGKGLIPPRRQVNDR